MKCSLCEKEGAKESPVSGEDATLINCEVCGNYEIDGFFREAYEQKDTLEKAKYFAFTREIFEFGDELPKIGDPAKMESLVEPYASKTTDEKIDNMLLYVKKRSKFLGESVEWDDEINYPITYSPNPIETKELRDHAREIGLIREEEGKVILKKPGWDRAVELNEKKVTPKIMVLG